MNITGDPIRTKVQKSGKEHSYKYYHCTFKRRKPDCRFTYIEEKKLTEQFAEIFEKVKIPAVLVEWALVQLTNELQAKDNIQTTTMENLGTERDQITRKQNELLDLLLNKVISEEQYQDKYRELQLERENAEARIKSYKDPFESIRSRSKSFSKDMQERFFTGDRGKKREILNAIGSNLFVKEKSVHFTIHPLVEMLSSAPEDLKEELEGLEPQRVMNNPSLISSLFENNSIWGG